MQRRASGWKGFLLCYKNLSFCSFLCFQSDPACLSTLDNGVFLKRTPFHIQVASKKVMVSRPYSISRNPSVTVEVWCYIVSTPHQDSYWFYPTVLFNSDPLEVKQMQDKSKLSIQIRKLILNYLLPKGTENRTAASPTINEGIGQFSVFTAQFHQSGPKGTCVPSTENQINSPWGKELGKIKQFTKGDQRHTSITR